MEEVLQCEICGLMYASADKEAVEKHKKCKETDKPKLVKPRKPRTKKAKKPKEPDAAE